MEKGRRNRVGFLDFSGNIRCAAFLTAPFFLDTFHSNKRNRLYLPFSIRTDQNLVQETKKLRVNIDDFQIKDLIGKGHYGEVHLAIENVTNDVYAIKKIPKISYAQSKERNIMAIGQSDWIPALQYAFQVSLKLYNKSMVVSELTSDLFLLSACVNAGSSKFVFGDGVFAGRRSLQSNDTQQSIFRRCNPILLGQNYISIECTAQNWVCSS